MLASTEAISSDATILSNVTHSNNTSLMASSTNNTQYNDSSLHPGFTTLIACIVIGLLLSLYLGLESVLRTNSFRGSTNEQEHRLDSTDSLVQNSVKEDVVLPAVHYNTVPLTQHGSNTPIMSTMALQDETKLEKENFNENASGNMLSPTITVTPATPLLNDITCCDAAEHKNTVNAEHSDWNNNNMQGNVMS